MRGCFLFPGALVLLFTSDGVAQPSTLRPTTSGLPRVGNGVTDGPGATLGRLFVRLSSESSDHGLPLDLVIASNVVTVDATTCSEPFESPCTAPGEGVATVSGHPSALFGLLTKLKLAGALYLPRGSEEPGGNAAGGSSIEAAIEGSLYAGFDSEVGETADLRLFGGNLGWILEWGAGDEHPSHRPYRDNTGTGILIGDKEALFFPGWVRAVVAAKTDDCILVDLESSEVGSATHPITQEAVAFEPDYDRARAAGFPEGVFGRIEVNFSGFSTASRIIPGASSNAVELRVPAVEVPLQFIRGDCNGDLAPFSPLPDVFTLLLWNFSGGREPPCIAACDADGDGKVIGIVSDGIYLLQHFFAAGPPPPSPYPLCGPEAEPSALSCEDEPFCP
jgi:hypothetical protein